MTLQINQANRILLDGQACGLALAQTAKGTIIYTPEGPGHAYKVHPMPFGRYSTAHDTPHKPGEAYDPAKTAGRAQLEADLRALLARI